MITTQFEQYDLVHVSNGQPEPPKRHTRKHATWACDNFDGYVWRNTDTEIGVARGIPGPRTPILVLVYQRTRPDITIEARNETTMTTDTQRAWTEGEKRMNNIASNGNTGDHYDQTTHD